VWFDRQGWHRPVIRGLGIGAGSTALWTSSRPGLRCTWTVAGVILRGTVGLTSSSAPDTALSGGNLKPNAPFVSTRSPDGSLGRGGCLRREIILAAERSGTIYRRRVADLIAAGFAAALAFALLAGTWLRRMHGAERTQMGQASEAGRVAAL
jgi:hypothetical protein